MIKLPEPTLIVEKEPDYFNRGHYYEGSKPWINSMDVINIPIGTKLYTEDQLKQAIRDVLDEAACLFSQDHVEYFGDEVRWEILKLKEELK